VAVAKEPHLVPPSVFFDHFDRALPALKLHRVQFAQMQHPPLQNPLAAYPQTFAQRIVNVLLAVFENAVGFQKHPSIFSAFTSCCLRGRLSHAPNRPFSLSA
jgi:hypothetical protein